MSLSFNRFLHAGCVSALAFAAVLALHRPACAQEMETSVPKFVRGAVTDINGVDMITGSFGLASPFSLGGPATGHLGLRVTFDGWSSQNAYKPTLTEKTPSWGLHGTEWDVTVHTQAGTYAFTCEYSGTSTSGSFDCGNILDDQGVYLEVTDLGYPSGNAPGLVRVDPKVYKFTDRNGTETVFNSIAVQLAKFEGAYTTTSWNATASVVCSNSSENCETIRGYTTTSFETSSYTSQHPAVSGMGEPVSVKYPNGEKWTISYGLRKFPKMASNLGYTIDDTALFKGTTQLSQITVVNSVTSGVGTVTETDDLSRTFSATWTGGCGPSLMADRALNSFTLPGGRQTTINYDTDNDRWQYFGHHPVSSIVSAGITWQYQSVKPTSGNYISTITAIDPLNNTTVVTSKYAGAAYTDSPPAGPTPCQGSQSGVTIGYPTEIKDPLNRIKAYTYLDRVTPAMSQAPEGNKDDYTYDTRRNLTRVISTPKPGGGSAVVTYNAGFDTTCSNRKTCNQPNWTEDARGYAANQSSPSDLSANRTVYTYDATHGGVKTMTTPKDRAATDGVRIRTYNTYETYQTSDGPIYRLTRTETCGLQDTQLSLTACPAAATTAVETRTYWESTFLPLTVTKTDGAGSLSAVTTYTYDAWGRVTSVDGPLSGTVDVSYVTYDAVGRKVFEIGIDPDGGGTLKRSMVKHTYNADDQETKNEVGTGNATDGSDFVVTSFTRMTYDNLGRLIKTEAVQP